jgi:hypothetical protein
MHKMHFLQHDECFASELGRAVSQIFYGLLCDVKCVAWYCGRCWALPLWLACLLCLACQESLNVGWFALWFGLLVTVQYEGNARRGQA